MSLTGKAEGKTLRGKINRLHELRGYSAYEVALVNGFEGTEEEWLVSLSGDGKTPVKGVDYFTEAEKQAMVDEAAQDAIEEIMAAQPKMELIHSVTVPEEGLSAITLKDLKLDAVTLVVNSPATSARGSARLQASYNGTVFMDTGAVNATDNGGRVFSLSQEFWKRNGQWQMQFVYQVTGWGMSVYTNTQGKVILESTYPYITGLQVTLSAMVVGAKIDIYGVKRNEN